MPYEAKPFVGGKHLDPAEFEDVIDPYTGDVVGTVGRGDSVTIDRAIEAATAAFETTRSQSAFTRRQVLRGVADGIRSRAEELANLIVAEAGKPIQYARGEVSRAATTFTLAAEELSRFAGELVPIDIEQAYEGYRAEVRRFPVGPISAISPFNFPLNLVAHKLAPALAVGSTVVLKPPPQAPLTSFVLAEICEAAGVVPGQLNVVHCHPPDAEILATDTRPRMLTFTGSAAVGWHLRTVAGSKKVTLELGGNAAAVVHEDADLDWSVRRLVVGSFAYAGQICISTQRIYTHSSIAAHFRDQFVEAARGLPVGDPRLDATVSGPVIDDKAAARIIEWVDEARAAGARVLTGGRREGRLVEPTVLEGVRPGTRLHDEEVFGPVVLLEEYSDFGDALAKVNDSKYGLQASIFTSDEARIRSAFNDLEVGGVIVNDFPMLRVDNFPYGGVKASGSGREGVRYAMEEMTEPRVLVTRGGNR